MKKLLTLVSLLTFIVAPLRAAATMPDYAKERADRAHGLTTPYGWFSLVALEWIQPDATFSVGSAKDNKLVIASLPPHMMQFAEHNGVVRLVHAEAGVTLAGHAVSAGDVLPETEEDEAAIAYESVRFWVIDRGGKKYLRVKDPYAKARVRFHGLQWYAPDAHYRIQAHWVPYTTPHTLNIVNKLGQITPTQSPGYVEFEIDGKKQTLTALSGDKNGLFFVMRDRTAPQFTDGGGRFLSTDGPSNGIDKPGVVTVDFNEAANPPCAYSPYATCPQAPRENRLEVAIPAGEKVYETP